MILLGYSARAHLSLLSCLREFSCPRPDGLILAYPYSHMGGKSPNILLAIFRHFAKRKALKALFGSIISFAQNAFTAADAMIRSAFRLASGKKLLEWVTASHEERRRTGALSEYIREFLPGALFGALLVFFSRALLFRAAGFLFFVFPAVVWYQSRTGK